MPKANILSQLRSLIPASRGLPAKAGERLPVRDRGQTEFTPLRPLRHFPAAGSVEHYNGVPRQRRWHDLDGWLGVLLVVVLPTLAAAGYYGLIAADRFVSQTEFVVRNADQASAGRLSSLIAAQASGAASAAGVGGDTDSYAVATFMQSHDGMKSVDRALDLRKIFARPEADWIAAFPGPFRADTDYRLYRYFSRMVDVTYDPATAVIRLSVEAFRPDDAKAVGEALLSGAEALVNRMDTRSQQDALRAALDQVKVANADVVAAQQKLTEFRLREGMIDPAKMSAVVIETIATLVAKSVDLKNQLADLARNAPASDQAVVLRNQIASVEEQIASEQRKLAGPDGSMTPILAEYQQLSLQREFADRIYSVALEQVEAARIDASRQHIFIEKISGPTLADYAVEPRRLLLVSLVFVLSMCAFGVLRHVVRDSRGHHGL